MHVCTKYTNRKKNYNITFVYEIKFIKVSRQSSHIYFWLYDSCLTCMSEAIYKALQTYINKQ